MSDIVTCPLATLFSGKTEVDAKGGRYAIHHAAPMDQKGHFVTTILLGANGKLGLMLAAFARLNSVEWRTQARSGAADITWSGLFDDPSVDEVFQRGSTIINMIGATRGDDAQLHDTNVGFVKTLLEKAAETGVAHVVLVSSAAAYGAGGADPFTEDTPLNPLTPYGKSKATMERVTMEFAANNNRPAITIARIGNVAGADALTAAAKRHISAGTEMPLHQLSDGSAPIRSYIGPRDLFLAMKALSDPHDGPPRVVNVVHPQPVGLDEVLSAYQNHVLPDLKWAGTPAPDGTPQSVVLSAETLQSIVKLEKYDDPADSLGQQVAEYLAQ